MCRAGRGGRGEESGEGWPLREGYMWAEDPLRSQGQGHSKQREQPTKKYKGTNPTTPWRRKPFLLPEMTGLGGLKSRQQGEPIGFLF